MWYRYLESGIQCNWDRHSICTSRRRWEEFHADSWKVRFELNWIELRNLICRNFNDSTLFSPRWHTSDCFIKINEPPEIILSFQAGQRKAKRRKAFVFSKRIFKILSDYALVARWECMREFKITNSLNQVLFGIVIGRYRLVFQSTNKLFSSLIGNRSKYGSLFVTLDMRLPYARLSSAPLS